MRDNKWVRLLAYVTGLVNQRLLLQNEYLIAENRILRSHLPMRLRLSDPERSTLAEIGKRVGRKDLKLVASVALPDTIMAWYRRLIAQKFDGSKRRSYPGRPPVTSEIEALIVRMARENSGWGYDRIVGALANLGHRVSDQTVGNVLRRYGIPPAPKRSQKTTWKEFLRSHWHVLATCDLFSIELSVKGKLIRYMVLFAIDLATRKVEILGVHPQPNGPWMEQIARNVSDEGGFLAGKKYLIHDRDSLYTEKFDSTLKAARVNTVRLPPRSPNLNAHAERFVRSVKEECLDHLILSSGDQLRYVLSEYLQYYHHERIHQGIHKIIEPQHDGNRGEIICIERLGGLLRSYHRKAA